MHYRLSLSWVMVLYTEVFHLPIPVFLGFPSGSAGKESACNAGDLGLIPGLGRFPGQGKGYPRWYSGLEKYTDCIFCYIFHFLLKFSLFSSICLPSSVGILMTVNLNSLLGKLLISVSLRIFCEVFILLTHLEHIHLCLHFT